MADQEIQVADKQEIEPSRGEFTREGLYFTPAVDICETETDLLVVVDMPGVSGDKVEIDLKDNILSLTGKMENTTPEGNELLREYREGNYYRTFRITDTVDQQKIGASMSDGVLTLKLPKAEKAAPRNIPITSE